MKLIVNSILKEAYQKELIKTQAVKIFEGLFKDLIIMHSIEREFLYGNCHIDYFDPDF